VTSKLKNYDYDAKLNVAANKKLKSRIWTYDGNNLQKSKKTRFSN